jgi:hypothetical protein
MLDFVPFNQDDIQSALNTKATELGFVDAIFPGSNTAFLTTLLSYAVAMNNANASLLLSEFFLATATKRKNILKMARMLGYEVKRKTSFQYQILIKCEAPAGVLIDQQFNCVLPKYSAFTDGNNTFYYMDPDKEIIGITQDQINKETAIYNTILNQKGRVTQSDLDDNNIKTFFFVTVKEGTLLKYYDPDYEPLGSKELCFTMVKSIQPDGTLGTTYSIPLDYQDIEQDGIEVFVSRYNAEGDYEEKVLWKNVQFQDIDLKKYNFKNSYVVLRDIDTNSSTIYFKFAGVCDEPILNAEVFVNVLISKGSQGNAQGKISFVKANSNFNVVPIGVTDSSIYTVFTYTNELVAGSDEESNEQIKEIAAIFHNVGNRAVTAQDYEAILDQHQLVQDSSVWGGEDYITEQLGTVFISGLPTKTSKSKQYLNVNGGNVEYKRIYSPDNEKEFYFTDENKSDILDYLSKYKMMTLKNVFIQPLYFNIDINVRMTKPVFDSTILNKIITSVTDLFDTTYETFNNEFFRSGISKIIYSTIGDSNGVDINVSQKIVLSKYNIIDKSNESGANKFFEIFLPLPFTNFTDENGIINTDFLPNITTLGFLTDDVKYGDNNLVVNFTQGVILHDNSFATFTISYNNVVCGSYTISKIYGKQFIYIKLNLSSSGATSDVNASSSLTDTFFTNNQYLNFVFSPSSQDARYIRNSTPRLNYFKMSSLS